MPGTVPGAWGGGCEARIWQACCKPLLSTLGDEWPPRPLRSPDNPAGVARSTGEAPTRRAVTALGAPGGPSVRARVRLRLKPDTSRRLRSGRRERAGAGEWAALRLGVSSAATAAGVSWPRPRKLHLPERPSRRRAAPGEISSSDQPGRRWLRHVSGAAEQRGPGMKGERAVGGGGGWRGFPRSPTHSSLWVREGRQRPGPGPGGVRAGNAGRAADPKPHSRLRARAGCSGVCGRGSARGKCAGVATGFAVETKLWMGRGRPGRCWGPACLVWDGRPKGLGAPRPALPAPPGCASPPPAAALTASGPPEWSRFNYIAAPETPRRPPPLRQAN